MIPDHVKKRIEALIQDDKYNFTCEICKQNSWTSPDRIFELREYAGGNVVVGGAIMPIIAMQCNNCCNIKFLNAVSLGLIDKTGSVVKEETKEPANG